MRLANAAHPPRLAAEVEGARNMLLNCAGAKPGERVLIVYETAQDGFYGDGMVAALEAAAATLRLCVETMEVAFAPNVCAPPPPLVERLRHADHAVFLARLGDQLRFRDMPDGVRPVVVYALDAGMLGSRFGRADHRAFVALKQAIDAMMARAQRVRVTCPLGTDYSGSALHHGEAPPLDVTVRRFPMSVFAPLAARDFRGRVAVSRFLVGTGSNYYAPYGVPLDDTVFVEIADGRMQHFHGDAASAARAKAHYAHVGEMFDIDPYVVHSWHAGIHPGCDYAAPARDNYERWSCGAFGNPRVLHFHTCGDYAPGEICWNVIDATVTVDDVPVWENGVLHIARVEGGARILRDYPEVGALFDEPCRNIGV